MCEVSLGNTCKQYSANYINKLPNGIHSTHGVGNWNVDGSRKVTIDGIEVELGTFIRKAQISDINYDEFIVYNSNQIKIKYMLSVSYIN